MQSAPVANVPLKVVYRTKQVLARLLDTLEPWWVKSLEYELVRCLEMLLYRTPGPTWAAAASWVPALLSRAPDHAERAAAEPNEPRSVAAGAWATVRKLLRAAVTGPPPVTAAAAAVEVAMRFSGDSGLLPGLEKLAARQDVGATSAVEIWLLLVRLAAPALGQDRERICFDKLFGNACKFAGASLFRRPSHDLGRDAVISSMFDAWGELSEVRPSRAIVVISCCLQQVCRAEICGVHLWFEGSL